MAEASDFKFCAQLGFSKTHQKTTARGKVGVALGWKAPKYLQIPFNISATAALSS